jgi:hypothetical protein
MEENSSTLLLRLAAIAASRTLFALAGEQPEGGQASQIKTRSAGRHESPSSKMLSPIPCYLDLRFSGIVYKTLRKL